MLLRRRALLAGVGGLAASGSLMTIKRSRAADAPIKIGYNGDLSGAAAPVGLPNRLGVEAARNYINQNGGINGKQIEIVQLDNAGGAAQAVAALREFASQGIHLTVGPATTTPALAVAPILPELKSVAIFQGTPEIRFTHELFNRYLFVTAQNNYTRENEIAQFVAQRYPEVTSWTGAIADVASGHGAWDAYVQALKAQYPKIAHHDVTIQDPTAAKFGSTDFKEQISRLMASSAPGFWTQEFGADGITFYQQGLQFGLSKHFKVMVDYGIDIDLPKTLKRNVPSDLWSSGYWYYGATIDKPMTKEVVRVFTASGDPYPHGFAQTGHAGVMALAAAIKESGSTDTDKVIAAMEGLKFETLTGNCYYRKEDHQLIGRSYMVRWEPTEAAPGWKAADFAAIEDADIVNPPAPGKKWEG